MSVHKFIKGWNIYWANTKMATVTNFVILNILIYLFVRYKDPVLAVFCIIQIIIIIWGYIVRTKDFTKIAKEKEAFKKELEEKFNLLIKTDQLHTDQILNKIDTINQRWLR